MTQKNIPNPSQQPNLGRLEKTISRPSRPNEVAGFSVEGHVKIFDPKTKEIFVEKRA